MNDLNANRKECKELSDLDKRKKNPNKQKNKVDIRGSLNNFPDFFRIGTFIDSTHMKLSSPSK